MTDDWKTLRIPAGQYERAKAQKEQHDRTWGQQIVREDDTDEPAPDVDTEALAAAIHEEVDTDAPAFDDVRDAIQTIEQRTGRIEQMLEGLGGGR